MSKFEQTIATLILLHGQGLDISKLLAEVIATASTEEMAGFCLTYGRDIRGQMENHIREIVHTQQPAAEPAVEPAAEHTTYALKASSSSSSSSSLSSSSSSSSSSSTKPKEEWGSPANLHEAEESGKALEASEALEALKEGGKGKGRGSKGQGRGSTGQGRGSKGQGRGGKGQGRGGKGDGGGKGVEPATGPSKPSRPKVKPTTACAHLVLGGIPKCPYEASGKCTFLHEGIFQDSGQPTGWLEVTLGTWTGQRDGEFGVSVATGGVVRWDTQTYEYEESSSEEFLDYLAERAVGKSKKP